MDLWDWQKVSMTGRVRHQTSHLGYQKWWDFQNTWTIYLQTLWHCCSVWAMGPSEHQDATAAAAAFPSGGIRRAQGSQQRAWASHCFHSGTPDWSLSPFFHSLSFPAALDEQRVSRRGWGRKSFSQHWRWLQPVPAGPVWVLWTGRSRGATLILKSPPSPHRLYAAVSHPLPHQSWTSQTHSPSNFPILTVALLSQGPTDSSQPHFLLLKSLCSPTPEESSPTVPAWIYFTCWKEIFELSTRSTTSTPGKSWAKSDHCSDLQCLWRQRTTTAGLCSAVIFAHPDQEHTSPLLPAMAGVCKWWRELTRGNCAVTMLSLQS